MRPARLRSCTREHAAPPRGPLTARAGLRRSAYFGCGTTRRYGFSVLNPCGNFFLASSSDTAGE